MNFLTINQAAKDIGLPHSRLRAMLSEHRLPGFYAGTRYYVNIDLLREQLESASRAATEDSLPQQ